MFDFRLSFTCQRHPVPSVCLSAVHAVRAVSAASRGPVPVQCVCVLRGARQARQGPVSVLLRRGRLQRAPRRRRGRPAGDGGRDDVLCRRERRAAVAGEHEWRPRRHGRRPGAAAAPRRTHTRQWRPHHTTGGALQEALLTERGKERNILLSKRIGNEPS